MVQGEFEELGGGRSCGASEVMMKSLDLPSAYLQRVAGLEVHREAKTLG